MVNTRNSSVRLQRRSAYNQSAKLAKKDCGHGVAKCRAVVASRPRGKTKFQSSKKLQPAVNFLELHLYLHRIFAAGVA